MGEEGEENIGGWGWGLGETEGREGGGEGEIPGVCDDDVVDGLVSSAEAGESDLDDHYHLHDSQNPASDNEKSLR